MRWLPAIVVALTLFACGGEPPAREQAAGRAPNIVIILADDLGYGDLGVTGAPDIHTPNLDLLAAEGVRFTHAYSNAPVCSPTRAALLSGMYQQRTGVDRVIYVSEREVGLDPKIRLLPSYLEEAGYVAGIFGKWHLGYPKENFPTRFGFEAFTGFVAGNIDYFAHTDRLGNPDLWSGEEPITDERYMTELIAGEAKAFIDRHLQRPFLLYLPFNAPHDPYQGPNDRESAGNQELTRQTNRTRAKFVEMVESLDAQIGEVIAHLKKVGLYDQSAIFFMSDNGGLPVVARNAPFSGFKTELWEGGVRSTLIARYPGHFLSGATVDTPAIAMDLFATALDIANAPRPDRPVDGVSLLPVLEGTGVLPERPIFFRYQNPKGPVQRAVVEGGWKYLKDPKEQEHLFHLAEDQAEQHDLSAEHADKLEAMRAQWEAWEAEVTQGAPTLPTYP
ncbi:MAG: sulfatase-like hydrolase/transferase [Acidobacteria bacterium]|nr:sulfatase-like hydrolase/transferase [Acidobacteriota bacterium]